MIKHQTVVYTPDNSGSVITKCIRVQKRSVRLGALPGQMCVVVLKKIWPRKLVNVKKSKLLKLGQICRLIVIRNARGLKRWGNFHIKSGMNAGLVLGQYNDPYATRMFGVVFREVRSDRRFKDVCRIATILC